MSGLERTEVVRKGFTRGQFVGMGLSAAVLSAAASPYVAKAKTVNFMVASTGRLSATCRGDGSDETIKIAKCFADNLIVEVDEPPAGVGYGFRAVEWGEGIVLRSGHEVNGRGANAKLLRVGKFVENGKALRNESPSGGDRSIRVNNLYIDGFRNNPDVPNQVGAQPSVGIALRSDDATRFNDDIRFTGVQVHNWPGTAIRAVNASNFTLTDVKTVNPLRVGLQVNTSRNVSLVRMLSANTGDDAIAFSVAGDPTNRPMTGVTMDDCESFTREDPRWGAGLKLAGVHGAVVTNCNFPHAKNAHVTIVSFPGFGPADIQVNDNQMLGGLSNSFEIRANEARNISVRRNYMHRPFAACVAVATWDGRAANFGSSTITDNTLSRPLSTHHIEVQNNLTGVNTGGNTLVYDYTTPPILKLITPEPGSTVSSPLSRIQAFAKASVSRRNNDLRKRNVKLFINDRSVDFEYFKSGGIVKKNPPVKRGANSVRVEATLASETTKKVWNFNVR